MFLGQGAQMTHNGCWEGGWGVVGGCKREGKGQIGSPPSTDGGYTIEGVINRVRKGMKMVGIKDILHPRPPNGTAHSMWRVRVPMPEDGRKGGGSAPPPPQKKAPHRSSDRSNSQTSGEGKKIWNTIYLCFLMDRVNPKRYIKTNSAADILLPAPSADIRMDHPIPRNSDHPDDKPWTASEDA